VAVATVGALALSGLAAYLTNTAPPPPAIDAEGAKASGRPYLLKLHAQWCPKCMLTRGVWSQVVKAYQGKVNIAVLDFTTDESTHASRTQATKLGLEELFKEYAGVTGIVLVLDGRTKRVSAEIGATREFRVYAEAIDDAIRNATAKSAQEVRPRLTFRPGPPFL